MQKDGRHISEETADFLYRLSQKRFYAMVAYAEKGAEMESSDLQEAISAYFTDGAVENSLNPAMLSEGEKARRTLMEESRRIPSSTPMRPRPPDGYGREIVRSIRTLRLPWGGNAGGRSTPFAWTGI